MNGVIGFVIAVSLAVIYSSPCRAVCSPGRANALIDMPVKG